MTHYPEYFKKEEDRKREKQEALTLTHRIIQTRAGGKVERCHTIPHNSSYNNAAHSWGVAMLMHLIWPEDFQRLALFCLCHDIAEAWVGDIPSPLKKYSQEVNLAVSILEKRINNQLKLPDESELSSEDIEKIKFCDNLEFYLWCREESELFGNKNVLESLRQVKDYFNEKQLPERARVLLKTLEENALHPKRANVIKGLCYEA